MKNKIYAKHRAKSKSDQLAIVKFESRKISLSKKQDFGEI
jgi:hypothetical protein